MEQRLIDANAIFDKVEANYRMSEGVQHVCEREFLNLLCDAPTVDAVQVTRCIDCNHSMKVDGMIGLVWCDHLAEVGAWVENDFFCADGERRSE